MGFYKNAKMRSRSNEFLSGKIIIDYEPRGIEIFKFSLPGNDSLPGFDDLYLKNFVIRKMLAKIQIEKPIQKLKANL